MNGKQDRDQQNTERYGEESVFPEVTRLPQSREADSQNQDKGEKAGDVESKLPHDRIVQ